MSLLTAGLLSLRHDPRAIVKLPRYLSITCVVVGIAWLAVLPLDLYSRSTYISENALLPGQVNTYYRGSEHNVFRAYRFEVGDVADNSTSEAAQKMAELFTSQGYKAARQKYNYTAAGQTRSGENVYAILQGPRADATEAIVLLAPWRNMDNMINYSGVALVLSLARYFKRWSLWSKDIIFVITGDSIAGPQAWVDAYHSRHSPGIVEDLAMKGGALQGAIAIDYKAPPGGWRFDKLHVLYDGVNGQLPNLDLVNSVVHIAENHEGVDTAIQRMWKHNDSYRDRLECLMRGVLTQGLGDATGPHSSFMPYHVDAITLQAVGDGDQDEMAFGRVLEGSVRSLNNLLEHFHQSFFFYLLVSPKRFVSIGTYLPSAMLVAGSFTITAVALWIRAGTFPSVPTLASVANEQEQQKAKQPTETEVLEHRGRVAVVPREMLETRERRLVAPITIVTVAHLVGLLPLYLFNNISYAYLPAALGAMTMFTGLEPYALAGLLRQEAKLTHQDLLLTLALSNLILGIALSTLSTLNFSLGLIVGLLAAPISFVRPISFASNKPALILQTLVLHLFSPTTVMCATVLGRAYTVHMQGFRFTSGLEAFADAARMVLGKAAWSWAVEGNVGSVVLWCVWWPAWIVAAIVTATGAEMPPEGSASFVIRKPAVETATGVEKHGSEREDADGADDSADGAVAAETRNGDEGVHAAPSASIRSEEGSTGRASGKVKKRK